MNHIDESQCSTLETRTSELLLHVFLPRDSCANTYLQWVVAITDDAPTQVLLSGGSAGGLSTYLHADYVRSQFAETVKFKAAPISGFFLNHATAAGVPDYINKMKWVFE